MLTVDKSDNKFLQSQQNRDVLTSIIILNYNYGRFLAQSIDSALKQTYLNTEVIVVDDGSTDDSRDVICRYGNRIRSVLKPNGGMASALNAGFYQSKGDAILFLDADDMLLPRAVSEAIRLFREPETVKVHWPLWVIDETGEKTGKLEPHYPLPEGDLRDVILAGGPWSSVSSPTSGNAWARRFLEYVLPVPQEMDYYRTCADIYLYTLAPVFGKIRKVSKPQGVYRKHGSNAYYSKTFQETLDFELGAYDQQCEALKKVLQKAGIEIDIESWKKQSWFHKVDSLIQDIKTSIPEECTFALVDNYEFCSYFQNFFPNNQVISFLKRDGKYLGNPENDRAAIFQLERLRASGTHFIIFIWPAFWWLEYYQGFCRHLRSNYECFVDNDRMITFDLRN